MIPQRGAIVKEERMPAKKDSNGQQLCRYCGRELPVNAVFCALFIGASAWLLDRKVNL